MKLCVKQVDLFEFPMQTRMPFRYGIAELRDVSHLVVRVQLEIDGRIESGLSAEGLAPKWFTKNPASSVVDDVNEMRDVIRSAARLAREAGEHPSVFSWWKSLYEAQRHAMSPAMPPLLWNFGVSLLERAVIDAFCRSQRTTLAAALRSNLLGIDLAQIRPELGAMQPAHVLPPRPRQTMAVRHTVGLSDPLTESEIPPAQRLDDGLPQSLQAGIGAYGLRFFKLKLCGNLQIDRTRLRDIATVLSQSCRQFAFTIDGNEQYTSLNAFADMWRGLSTDPTLADFLSHLIFVEQPIHRAQALDEQTHVQMRAWKDRPAIIIDESDGELSSLPRALECGYVGTSHKNCKGIFKSIANLALLAHRQAMNPSGRYVISGEDLSSVGPVSMLQDLAMAANLGIDHIERNGHHYFRGLSMWPDDLQNRVLASHGDLYARLDAHCVALRIVDGLIRTDSVIGAPFGYAIDFDPADVQ